MPTNNANKEVKHEAEVNDLAILEELKLFFMNNKYRGSEPQDCSRYNSVLEMYNAELVYDEEERVHKLWVNDEPLESQNAIENFIRMIESSQLDAQHVSNSAESLGNTYSYAERDNIQIDKIIAPGSSVYVGGKHKHKHYDKPILDEVVLSSKHLCLMELQKKLAEYYQEEYWYLKRLFDDTKTPIENSYINLSIITADEQKRKQKQLQEVDNVKSDQISRTIDERTPSHEDLFVHKEPIALMDLFKIQSGEYASPRRLIVFGRAGIGKSILCQYLAVRI